jgi:hypothetical protein
MVEDDWVIALIGEGFKMIIGFSFPVDAPAVTTALGFPVYCDVWPVLHVESHGKPLQGVIPGYKASPDPLVARRSR